MLNINEILYILPHRYPFILVDKIISFKKFIFLNAIKNISLNEPCFQGHFPENPIYPGVLLLESMIQTTGILLYKSVKKQILKNKDMYYITGMNDVRFKHFVFPGDQILIKSILEKQRKKFFFFKSIVKVKKKIVCKAKIMCVRIIKK
ncbi:3-hydroxyacyl-ACP dehydratase FabZ [Enterobacteriaceae endosymbiont of Donacia tomentosa]|uniref:3-hydroxyacyl-ACP dehydratase FabZ n=1 Tax=Enterobacteriaceae endosymbiont of Donacia tomentosa TaxID=2675787 RepID=UPI001448C729|nr:3-hydroxyacyl-ACP dehydratase FabZ [Enterobacteriaceae endosymbiont of Donacia tomentosa]QJC31661.1 3-hydroxyacyl-ACP dehydratase FabZ [Enterobacteriaceae endosymbiont of Donacia tomentosa]